MEKSSTHPPTQKKIKKIKKEFSNELFGGAPLNEPRCLEYMDVVTFVVGWMLRLRKGCDISSTQAQHREGTEAKVSAVMKTTAIIITMGR